MKAIFAYAKAVIELARNDESIHRTRHRLTRKALGGVALVASLAMAFGAHAAYPERPIEVIISFPPAGATDALARAVGQGLSEKLGQTVVVQNRPGAGGAIGLTAAARAQPDGYTLYLAATTNQAIAAAIYQQQDASLLKDFVPIGQVGFAPHALVVPASLPIKTVSELLAYLKEKPGAYNFASQGTGTLSHLESELFIASNKLEVTHIPYKGSSQALPDVANGSSAMMFDSITGSMPMVQAGKIRYLAVASSSRVSLLPDVPTLTEAGVKNVVADNVFGLFAPKGVAPEIAAKLSRVLETVLAEPQLKTRLAKQGSELRYASAQALGETITEEHRYWAGVVKTAGIKPQ
jgi:tripartite-type tricarboxylate transporter receptor subunit TctC